MPAAVAAAAVAAASGGALLLCLLLNCCTQSASDAEREREEDEASPLLSGSGPGPGREAGSGSEEEEPWPDRAPLTCCEATAVAARTARRTWELTVGRWGLHGLAFGIKRHMKRQGNLQHEYSGNDCLQLKGHQTYTEVSSLLEYLKLCMFFSKKSFSAFLKFGGYKQDDILIHKARARLMQPSFALVCDQRTKCLLLFIRGAISTKERLTAATAAEVPFHHIILSEGKISNVVLGHAHCGMLAGARWIAKLIIPHLHNKMQEFSGYHIKVIGHSMGAGIGAILTYILREHYEFLSCSCLAFAPPACMTWELAESGKDFITSLVNRNDVVPAFSKVSSESLRSEVMVSSKLDDVQDHFHHGLFASISQRVAFIKSHMLSISNSTGKIADRGSSISEPLLKDAADTIPPTANGHSVDCSQQQVVASEETVVLVVSNDHFTIVKPVDSGLASQEGSDSNVASDTQQSPPPTGEGEEEAPNQNGPEKDKQKEPVSAGCSSRQLFPPGRIIHMVALPPPLDPNPGDGTSSCEIIGIYETPRDLYGKIRLAPNMIKEHYMPSYISTMESLLEQLQKEDDDDTSVCTASNDL
ncbi:hypothetical protein BDA96_01G025200 [Sorghum bicolor]|uniref:Fungal lipase-type domain-containing protein n=2 Tax=Sorghum bicolor TaxID=4558 RepID=A0A921RUR1_SORBI|nr:uncharacterized protein LOC8080201 [Sorghum bicolor]EER90568.1 hypothetical protein SORBI_3001G024200 [Sorghum bicolor]KAG0546803.1 hypothetical protein BDA96_01G025200 [Sorghum bicolor]|eukprot:XP_002463570.1 uncharacterized protein LOC8080201 [Sorghum bicolor]